MVIFCKCHQTHMHEKTSYVYVKFDLNLRLSVQTKSQNINNKFYHKLYAGFINDQA